MIILGLIAAAVFGLDLVWKNHYTIRSPALFGQTLRIHNAAVFFIVGAITGAVLLLRSSAASSATTTPIPVRPAPPPPTSAPRPERPPGRATSAG